MNAINHHQEENADVKFNIPLRSSCWCFWHTQIKR